MKRRILALIVVLATATACAPGGGDEEPQVQDGVVVPGEQ